MARVFRRLRSVMIPDCFYPQISQISQIYVVQRSGKRSNFTVAERGR